jgi:RHS repeat-associated protein
MHFQKEGYDFDERLLPERPNNYLPDSNNPVVITMWKPQGAEPIIHTVLESRVPYNGTSAIFNLMTGKKAADGDLKITLSRFPLKIHRGRSKYDWKVEIETINGGLIEENDPYPYGQLTDFSGDLIPDFGYAGYYMHQPSGLYLTLYRAYKADLGRWLNRDPIQEAGGLNLYDYVANNPIMYVDPLGLAFGDYWDIGATANYYNQVSANGLSQGGIGGYAAFAAAQAGEDLLDLFGAGGVQQSAAQSGAASGDPCHHGAALGYGALTVASIALNAIPGEGKVADETLRFSAEKAALIEMAKLDRNIGKGISEADAQAYIDLNRELTDPYDEEYVRIDPGNGPEANPDAQGPHLHIGKVDYIPIK